MTNSLTKVCALATAWFSVLSLAHGCGSMSKPAQTPDAVVREFARALGDGKASAAYALMSPAYRQRVSYAAWQKQFEQNPQEVAEAEHRLARVRGPAELQAVHSAEGKELRLVRASERGAGGGSSHWYIASDEIEFYDQSTPRAALSSFIAALTRRRYDVVLRLMPDADKESVTEERMQQSFGHAYRDDLERMLSELRAHTSDPIEITGDRATMPYAGHKRVQFVRESGRWRIEDPE